MLTKDGKYNQIILFYLNKDEQKEIAGSRERIHLEVYSAPIKCARTIDCIRVPALSLGQLEFSTDQAKQYKWMHWFWLKNVQITRIRPWASLFWLCLDH